MNLGWAELAIGLLVTALDVAAIARAVYRAHGVERTLAWILAIIAFPGVGAAAYLLAASPSVRLTTSRKQRAAHALQRQTCAEVPGELAQDCAVLQLSSQLTGLTPSTGNRVTLLAESDAAFEQIESALGAARDRIYAEYYLIRRDNTGHRFLDLLAARARDGVEVKLLYDAVGSLGVDSDRLATIRQAGGRAEVFLPVNPFGRRWSVHLRNHRKLIAVDGQVGFTGGMNVGDEYSGRARRRGGLHFRDSHLALTGPSVLDLEQVFLEDWAFATDEKLSPSAPSPSAEASQAGRSVVSIVPSGPDQERNASEMVYFSGVASARTRVFLTSPYFIPAEPLLYALSSAALRGVDVRILVPARPDVVLVGAAARSYYRRLIRSGVRIFEYLPSMLHAKTLAVDGSWGIVGSANLDLRSFRLNFELGAVVRDADFAAELEQRFFTDLEQSREVTPERLAARGRLRRFGDGIAWLFSPLL